MLLSCTCGHVIRDWTDNLPWIGYLIAAQDIEQIYEQTDGTDERLPTRLMYQCVSCGRLWIEDQSRKKLISFVPEDPAPNFLGSIEGEKWKRVLTATWTDTPVDESLPRGCLDWTHTSEEDAASFDDWAALEKAYRARFEELKGRGILRHALLTKNGETIHSWNFRTNG